MPAGQIPGTAALSAAILGISLTAKLTEQFFQFGIPNLNYQLPGILNLELWRLVTYPFAISSFLNLMLGILVLWMFGGWFETSYGTRDYLRFFFAATIGAGILAIPFTFLVNMVMPFFDPGLAEGPDPAFDAMLVALALTSPNSNILFGFVLPMRAKTVIWIILGLHVVSGIYNGAAAMGVSLAGMAMGYLLVTGYWRPSRLRDLTKMWRLRRRRQGLYVVPPKKDHTLH
ncbi:MAG: rhomboid family intramembrane serine protease [Myxococcota bacterium]